VTASSSRGSSSLASSLSALLALGVRATLAVDEAPSAGTSKLVLSLREEEDPAAALVVDLVSVSPVDAGLIGVDLIILSGDSKDKVDWEALIVEDEVD
jgi:hypothetical protein